MPLLPKIGGRDDEDVPLPFSPFLREHESGFNGLTESNLIGEERAFRKRRPKSEQGRFDLMRIQINLGIDEGTSELFDAVGGTSFGEFMCEELAW
jgi:hypothetical protein